MRKWVVVSTFALFFGCGGGSAPSTTGLEPEQEQAFSAGLVRGDAPTTLALVVTKPFADSGNVELAEAPAGPFGPLAGTLPMPVQSGDRCVLRVTFTPPFAAADSLQQGAIKVLFRPESGAAFPVTLKLDAQIEKPSARLTETHLQLGNVPVGETVACNIAFENTSQVTPVTLTDATLAAGDFSLAPDALFMPATVAPGSTFLIRLVCAPKSETIASSLLQVFHSAASDPLEATLEASGIAASKVVDFGAVTVDAVAHETGWIYLDVPPEGVGILIEAWGNPFSLIDLAGFEGPSGKVYETDDLAGPLEWLSGYPAGANGLLNVKVPDSARPEVQLEPGGGTYRFKLRNNVAGASALQVRATITERRLGQVSGGTLDLHVFLAADLVIADPTKPMSDQKLGAAIKTIDGILGASGIRLGTVTFSFLEPPFDFLVDEEDTEALIAVNTATSPEGALNLFFVGEISYGITAVAGSSPGTLTGGTPFDGVVVDYNAASGTQLGVTAAHEISHYLGWFGTTVLPQSADGFAMVRHPLLRPGLPESFLSPPGTYQQAQITANSMQPTGDWCGTCTRPSVR